MVHRESWYIAEVQLLKLPFRWASIFYYSSRRECIRIRFPSCSITDVFGPDTYYWELSNALKDFEQHPWPLFSRYQLHTLPPYPMSFDNHKYFWTFPNILSTFHAHAFAYLSLHSKHVSFISANKFPTILIVIGVLDSMPTPPKVFLDVQDIILHCFPIILNILL